MSAKVSVSFLKLISAYIGRNRFIGEYYMGFDLKQYIERDRIVEDDIDLFELSISFNLILIRAQARGES